MAICSSCFDDFSRTLVAGQEGAQEVGKLVSVYLSKQARKHELVSQEGSISKFVTYEVGNP